MFKLPENFIDILAAWGLSAYSQEQATSTNLESLWAANPIPYPVVSGGTNPLKLAAIGTGIVLGILALAKFRRR